MDYIKISTYHGDSIEGFQVSHPRELPKSAKHLDYHMELTNGTWYDVSRYMTCTKTNTKYFLWRKKSAQY